MKTLKPALKTAKPPKATPPGSSKGAVKGASWPAFLSGKTGPEHIKPIDWLPGLGLLIALSTATIYAPTTPKLKILTQAVPVQVGLIQASASFSSNTSVLDSAKPSAVKENEPQASEAPAPQTVSAPTKNQDPDRPELAPAQRGHQEGKEGGYTYGVPHINPLRPELGELPYGARQAVLIVLVDWTGAILNAELLSSTGDLGRDLMIVNGTRLLNMANMPEFKEAQVREGQKVWITFGIDRSMDPVEDALP